MKHKYWTDRRKKLRSLLERKSRRSQQEKNLHGRVRLDQALFLLREGKSFGEIGAIIGRKDDYTVPITASSAKSVVENAVWCEDRRIRRKRLLPVLIS